VHQRKNSLIVSMKAIASLRRICVAAVVSAASFSAFALEKVVFYTDWKAQAEHGGFYQALADGTYRKYGLEVTIRPGGPQTDNTRLLAAGAIQLGMISNSFQALTLAEKGADVKIVMAAFQKDPQMIMAHPGTAFKTLSDLKGRPIFMDDAFRLTYFPWMKARFGLADAQARKYAFSLTPWLQARTAAQEGYVTSEPFTSRKAGVAAQVIVINDVGYPGYAAMIAATGDLIRTNPKLVRAFVKASQEGWQTYMTSDGKLADALILKDNPQMDAGLLTYGRQQLKKYGIVTSGDAVAQGAGTMTAQRWQQMYQDMSALGLYSKNLDPAKAYDLQFLSSSKQTHEMLPRKKL
jgi:NitT/TauT family transport system substrate-binding protein